MLDACEQEQWESLTEMEVEHRQLVEEFFIPTPTESEVEAITKAVHQIQELEKELIQRCTEARQDCLTQLGKIDVGKRASAAYSDNTRK
jgi:hypothetical protein